jgi:general secretion pathway protein C
MAKLWTFGLWAAVAASAVFWGLKLFVPARPAPPHATVAALATSPRGDLTRLFGTDPVAAVAEAPPANARFQLVGVVAPRAAFPSREGVALIAVDGKPPKAYRVGAAVENNLVLQSVAQRGASLGPRDGAATVALDIPPPAAAATGSLPSVSVAPPAVPVPPRPGAPGFPGPQRANQAPGAMQPAVEPPHERNQQLMSQ